MFNRIQKLVAGVAALAALALGGSAIAGAASSQTTGSTSQSTSRAQAPPAFKGPAHGTAAHEDAEKPVTGDVAAKAQAAGPWRPWRPRRPAARRLRGVNVRGEGRPGAGPRHAAQVAATLTWAERHDTLVIEDDYGAEYRYDREPIGALQGLAPERVVYAG